MKYLILFIFAGYSQIIFANGVDEIQSDKLTIIGGAAGSDPDNWLQYYGLKKKTSNNNIRITVKFDVAHANEVIITDMYAEKNLCKNKSSKLLLHLYLDANKNNKEIGAFIPFPCFVDLGVKFKLTIITADKKYYTNTVMLKASIGVFEGHWSSDSMN